MSGIFHISGGRAYGPANPHETMVDYRKRIKSAYGALNGVKFVQRNEQCSHDPIYIVTGQCPVCKERN